MVGRFTFSQRNASAKLGAELALALRELGFEPHLVSLLEEAPAQPDCLSKINGVNVLPLLMNGSTQGCMDSGFEADNPYKSESIRSAALVHHIMESEDHYVLMLSLSIGLAALNTVGSAVRRARLPWCHLLVEEVLSLALGRDKVFWARPLIAIRGMLTAIALYGVCLRRAKVICCLTPDLRDLLLRVGYSKEKVHLMPNIKSRHSSDFLVKPEAISVGGDDDKPTPFPYLFFSGHLSFTKEEFVNLSMAIAILKARFKSIGLVLVGTAEGRQVLRLHSLAKELGIQELVCWKGFVSDERLRRLRSQALAHIMLKRNVRFNRYNFSTRLLEYLATSRPVLLSNIKTHLAYFTHGKNALIVDPNNSDQIVQAIEWVYDNPERANGIGRAGCELLKVEFDGALNVQSLLKTLGISCSVPLL